MTQSENAAKLSAWGAPECPFLVEYAPQTLDSIRLAVVDAFFSLPRGGAEIGGILWGHWDGERLAIVDYAPLDCEHAFGPSFTLSPRDRARLADLLAAPAPDGLRPVGWYHSHTRSEIFLSDADREIHRHFFPEPWQVALILKPHTYDPTRAGFFFRGPDGEIHGENSYKEFVLAPLAGAPARTASAPAVAPAEPSPQEPTAVPVSQSSVAAPPLLPAPKFLDPPRSSSGRWVKIVVALLTGFALGAAAYLTRDLWLPPVLAWTARLAQRPPAPLEPPPLGLNTIDSDGQLQILWNRDSAAVKQASAGVLTINSGGPQPREIPLDKPHLLSGIFTFERQTERVDVALDLTQPDGGAVSEATTFMGSLPDQKPAADQATPEQIDTLAKQMARIQSDLDSVIERDTNLKKSVDLLSKQLHDQQRIRPRR